jgi:Tfp pilus assembly protein PilF
MSFGSIGGRRGGALVLLVTLGAAVLAGCGGSRPQPKEAPALDSKTLARQAESFLSVGRMGDALDSIDQAIALEPSRPRWHYMRGTILFQAGRYEEAEVSLERSLELDPYLTDARNFLGAICTQEKRWAEAEAHFRKALSDPAYPTPELVYYNLALLYAAQGRDDEALTQLRRAVEINPKYYQAHFELASTLDRMDRLAEAAQEYEVAAPGYRQSGDYYYRLGLAYFRLGEAFKARENLRRAIDVAPGSESAARAGDLLEMIH